MRLASTLPLAFGFFLGLGCGGAGYTAPADGPPAIAEPTAADQTCSRDSECVLVQDCCGCERSGRRLAVRRDRVEALETEAASTCAATSCVVADSAHRSCTASGARCLGGRCVPAID